MNHGIFIVKIIEKSINLNYNGEEVLKILIEFPQIKSKISKKYLNLILWGTFREDFLKYYKIKDYLLIEGIITNSNYENEEDEINLIAKRVYPFLLD
ncbi:unnamed protein product [Dictyota dichotoma]